MALMSQQVEISPMEARALIFETYKILCRPIDNDCKMGLFEAMAYPHLKKINMRLTKRIAGVKPSQKFKITFSAQELLAIHQLVADPSPVLYNALSTIDRKVLNYDQIINLY